MPFSVTDARHRFRANARAWSRGRSLTIVVGAVGGLMVGMTSVGSGSLIIIALMALYPALKASQLVGTDLAQAVPLVVAAGLAHLLMAKVDWG